MQSFKRLNDIDTFELCVIYKSFSKEMLEMVFSYHKDTFDFSFFCDLVKTYSVYACYDGDRVLGVYWLTDFEANSCRVHFLLSADTNVRKALKLSKYALSHHLDNSVKVITCIIPTKNKLIKRFAELIGFNFFNKMADFYDDSPAVFGFLNKVN